MSGWCDVTDPPWCASGKLCDLRCFQLANVVRKHYMRDCYVRYPESDNNLLMAYGNIRHRTGSLVSGASSFVRFGDAYDGIASSESGRLSERAGFNTFTNRWYGVDEPSAEQGVFIERKKHRDAWTGEFSMKVKLATSMGNVGKPRFLCSSNI